MFTFLSFLLFSHPSPPHFFFFFFSFFNTLLRKEKKRNRVTHSSIKSGKLKKKKKIEVEILFLKLFHLTLVVGSAYLFHRTRSSAFETQIPHIALYTVIPCLTLSFAIFFSFILIFNIRYIWLIILLLRYFTVRTSLDNLLFFIPSQNL